MFGTDIVKMKTFISKTSDGVDKVWDWEIIPIALPGDEARGIKAYMNRWHLLECDRKSSNTNISDFKVLRIRFS